MLVDFDSDLMFKKMKFYVREVIRYLKILNRNNTFRRFIVNVCTMIKWTENARKGGTKMRTNINKTQPVMLSKEEQLLFLMSSRSTYRSMHDETEISEIQLGDKAKEWICSNSLRWMLLNCFVKIIVSSSIMARKQF